jgi:hypothetical protein
LDIWPGGITFPWNLLRFYSAKIFIGGKRSPPASRHRK